MTRPMCPLCLKRKEKKLKKDIIEAKKKTKEAERQKEKTRRELTQLQQNYATIESYWNARRARGEIMLTDVDLLAAGERMRDEERQAEEEQEEAQTEALDLSKEEEKVE